MQGFKNRIKILYFARFNQLFALREVSLTFYVANQIIGSSFSIV